MLVLVFGLPKSGETIVYQMLWDILEDHGKQQEQVRRNHLRHLPGASNGGLIATGWTKFEPVLKLSNKYPYLLARTHGSLTPSIEKLIDAGQIKLFVTKRGLKDSAKALHRHAKIQVQTDDPGYCAFSQIKSISQAKTKLEEKLSRAQGWKNTEKAHKVSFKKLISNPFKVFCELNDSIGLGPASSALLAKYKKFSDRLIAGGAIRKSSDYSEPPSIITGLVSGKGYITSLQKKQQRMLAKIQTDFPWSYINSSTHISHSGFICPILLGKKKRGKTAYWKVEVPSVFTENTKMTQWSVGMQLNLEQLSHLGDDIGGQIMFGAGNNTAKIVKIEKYQNRRRLQLSKLKGSTFVEKPNTAFLANNIALTASRILANGNVVVHVSPFTLNKTNIKDWRVGDVIAIEPELLSKARVPPPYPGI